MIKKVDEGFYRGPAPKHPVDVAEQWTYNVHTVIDLEHDGNNRELEWLRARGMIRLTIEMRALLPPHKEDVELALQLIDAYKCGGVYLHCLSGVDRTGFVVASYRIHAQNWTKKAAVKEMREMGMHFWFYWWAWFL